MWAWVIIYITYQFSCKYEKNIIPKIFNFQDLKNRTFYFRISHSVAKKIENEALMQWKDCFLNATSKVIALTFDSCNG